MHFFSSNLYNSFYVFINLHFSPSYIRRKFLRLPQFYRESFLARCQKEILAPFGYPRTCDSGLFNFWVENILVNQLKKGQIVIMDNAKIHKTEKTKKLIENAGCKLAFLPPYSPDLNPIENFWGNLKKNIKSCSHKFDSLMDTIQYVIT